MNIGKLARYAGETVDAVIVSEAYRATKYVSPRMTVKATRRHKLDRRAPIQEFVVTVGRPNSRERHFIKALQKAGEPFPVRKIQLRF